MDKGRYGREGCMAGRPAFSSRPLNGLDAPWYSRQPSTSEGYWAYQGHQKQVCSSASAPQGATALLRQRAAARAHARCAATTEETARGYRRWRRRDARATRHSLTRLVGGVAAVFFHA